MEKPAGRSRRARRALTLVALIVGTIKVLRLSPVRVEGVSMAPTLPDGALVAVGPVRSRARVGSVVVVRRPEGSEHLKRVVATAGEWFRREDGSTSIVPSGNVAVVGDNRDGSTDSRHYGPVRREDVLAVARFCYWPPRAWRRLP